MSVSAEGAVSVEQHEPTGGIKIIRETPELDYTDEQTVVIPEGDVDALLEKIAPHSNKCVVEKSLVEAVDTLIEVGESA